jgi:hypothetical protein
MTYSGTSTSSTYIDCWYAYDGTHTINDLISNVFRWDLPTELPTMYVQRSAPSVIAPHIEVRSCKQFLGHKFKIGGSKK